MIKRNILMLIIGIAIIPSAFSQIYTNSFDSIFNAFKNNIQTEFDQFKAANDSIFISFLKNSWEEYETFLSERPARPKPRNQPIITTINKKPIELIPEIKNDIKPDFRSGIIYDTVKAKDKEEDLEKDSIAIKNIFSINSNYSKIQMSFYGTDIDFTVPIERVPILSKVSNIGIAKFYEDLSQSELFSKLLQQSQFYRQHMKLNGWAYLKLCESISKNLYSDKNMQLLTVWYLVTNSGQKIKVAYSGNDVYLLCAFDTEVFEIRYILINNEPYYVYLNDNLNPNFNKLFTYKGNHKQQVDQISLTLHEAPAFSLTLSDRTLNYNFQSFKIQTNNNLIKFYSEYPDCAFEITLNAPLSDNAFLSLDSFLSKRMRNFNEKEKLDFLLDFVQHAFPYQTDEEQFGRENYLFADESLKYPFNDCEDRVALMAQLIKRYTSLKSVGLDYPDHISLAVNLKNEINGTYITVNNLKYYVCDPTYIGAKCGVIMPFHIDIKPKIIYLK